MSISPNHIAIIMDGNRRWAKKRRLEALVGHDKGAETLKEITKSCADEQIKWLTVFAFSSENWTRPKNEVAGLMRLITIFIDCLLYTSPSPRDLSTSRMPSSA